MQVSMVSASPVHGADDSKIRFSALGHKEYPGYYIPTKNDFRPHVENFYDLHWSPERFDWKHDVRKGLRERLEGLPEEELKRLARMNAELVGQRESKALEAFSRGEQSLRKKAIDIIAERQFQGLKDITNHALTAEQAAIAPLSTGIITFKRYPVIQEAMTTFVTDEAKHSSIFTRYLEEKLGGETKVYKSTVFNFDNFSRVAKVVPSAAVFLALAVETVGGSFFEFFGDNITEPLFRDMCATIANRDEKRHMGICRDVYNELYRNDTRWERFRNRMLMKGITREVYGEQSKKDHYLMQACASFGVEPQKLMEHITRRVTEEFAKIGYDIRPEELMPAD